MKTYMKTAFAIVAVALMILVAVTPAAGALSEFVAASDSNSVKVVDDYNVKVFKQGDDLSDMVFYGNETTLESYGVATKLLTPSSSTAGAECYWRYTTGELLRCGDVPGYVPVVANYGLPAIEMTFSYPVTNNDGITVSVEIAKDDIVLTKSGTDPGPVNIGTFTNNEFPDRESVVNFKLGSGDPDQKFNLGMPAWQRCGIFDISVVATQSGSVQKINATADAGNAVTVSGEVKDASSNAIKSYYGNDGARIMGLNVKFAINGDTQNLVVVPVDKDGKYSLSVVAGTSVKVVGFAYVAPGTTYAREPYTFNDIKDGVYYDFGTVFTSATKMFTAKEKTGVVAVKDADNTSVPGKTFGNTADLKWYYEYKNDAASDYTVVDSSSVPAGVTDGKAVVILSDTDASGNLYFTYIAPVGTATGKINYNNYLIVKPTVESGDNIMYTFDVITPTSGQKNVAGQISTHKGMADVKSGKGTLHAKETTVTVTVKDANGKAIPGLSVPAPTWYSQTKNDEDKYIFESWDGTAKTGYVYKKALPATNETDVSGKTYFSMIAPTKTSASNDNDPVFSLILTASTSVMGFDTITIPTTLSEKSLADIIKNHNGMADIKTSGKSISSTEKIFKVSGSVVEPNVAVTIEHSDLSDGTIYSDAKGNYSFYAKANSSPTITPIGGYTVPSVTVSTLEKDVTVNFELKKPVAKDIVYNIYGFDKTTNAATKVTFYWSINGVSNYAQVDSDTTTGIASFTLNYASTDDVEVYATADGYFILPFVGYETTAIKLAEKTFRFMYEGTPVETEFSCLYRLTIDDEFEEISIETTMGYATVTGIDMGNGLKIFGDGATTLEESTFAFMNDAGVLLKLDEIKVQPSANDIIDIDASKLGYVEPKDPESKDITVGYCAPSGNIHTGESFKMYEGDSISLSAPSIDGYKFVCWMVNDVKVSDSADYKFTLPISNDDKVTITALYEDVPVPVPEKDNSISPTVLILGIIAIVIALIAVAYVVVQAVRKN